MHLSRIFIERPVATTILVAAIVLFGLIAFRSLPVNDLPNVDFPTISVTAELPGANPEVMASTVATPLERQFSQIPGVDTMNSVNSTGRTRITLQFTLERNIDSAAQDVQTAISQAIRRLPDDMDPPTLRKVNPADAPILFLAVTSSTLPMQELEYICRSAHRSTALDDQWRGANPGFGRRNMPCVCICRSGMHCPNAGSVSTRSSARFRTRTAICLQAFCKDRRETSR